MDDATRTAIAADPPRLNQIPAEYHDLLTASIQLRDDLQVRA